MLSPVADTLENQADAAQLQVSSARSSMLGFLGAGALAGAAVGASSVVLLMVSAPMLAAQHSFTRLVQAAVFGIGLAIVVFAGAQLSTGVVMTQVAGFLRRTVDLADAALVWLGVLIGNLVGSVVLAVVVDASGIFTTTTPNQPPVFQSALGAVAVGLGDLSGGQLLLRAVLCNLLISAAIFTAARAASDGLRLFIIWAAVLAFVTTGLEYSVATMTTLSLAALSDVGTWGDLSRNLTFTVPGNLIGGALFVLLAHGARRAAGGTTGDVVVPAAAIEPPADAVDPAIEVAEAAATLAPATKKVPAKKAAAAKKFPAKKAPAKVVAKKAPAAKKAGSRA